MQQLLSILVMFVWFRFGGAYHKKFDDDEYYPVMSKHSIRSTLLLASSGAETTMSNV